MHSDDRIADRYVPKKRLGRGGMGEVWLARDARLERDVALKLLFSRYAADPDFLVRFFAEAQSVAGLNHPHVVPILDFGHGRESPFLVMEFVEGGSLAGLLSRPFIPERAFEIVADAARGAGAAHSQGVVHRDVKPGNILLTEEGVAKLADFGIASTANAEVLTEPGAAMGSPYYISPEQAAGKRASPRSDVYSLGVVLYELLTGTRPFDGDSVTAVAIAHFEEDPRPPSALRPDLSEDVDRVVMRCLAKDPTDRFRDGTELAFALSAPGDDRVLPPSDATRHNELSAGPFARKSLVMSLLILLGIASLLGATWWATGGLAPDNPAGARPETQQPQDRGGPAASPTPPARDPLAFVEPPLQEDEEEEEEEEDRDEKGRDQRRAPARSGEQTEETEAKEPAPSPVETPTTSLAPEPSPDATPTEEDPEDSSQQD